MYHSEERNPLVREKDRFDTYKSASSYHADENSLTEAAKGELFGFVCMYNVLY